MVCSVHLQCCSASTSSFLFAFSFFVKNVACSIHLFSTLSQFISFLVCIFFIEYVDKNKEKYALVVSQDESRKRKKTYDETLPSLDRSGLQYLLKWRKLFFLLYHHDVPIVDRSDARQNKINKKTYLIMRARRKFPTKFFFSASLLFH